MSNIRDLINQPVRESLLTLEHEKGSFVFKGSPDANVLAESLLVTPDRVALLARHWSTVCEQTVNPDIVKHVLVVYKTLQPPSGEESYDVTDVARLACKEGPLFLQMIGKAYEVLGLTEEDQNKISTFDEVAAGNSSGRVATD